MARARRALRPNPRETNASVNRVHLGSTSVVIPSPPLTCAVNQRIMSGEIPREKETQTAQLPEDEVGIKESPSSTECKQ